MYGGKLLPNLKPETAIYYHNRCIDHFVSLSHDDPEEATDESFLAAAVILRFYEEIDSKFYPGLRHAAYWIALRQEILTAFSKQRPFRLPLGPCERYRSFEPTTDYVWADRLVIHCAEVLQYCFGSDTHVPAAGMTSSERLSRYDELIAFHTLWEEHRSQSFLPIYARDADPERGEAFPALWYLSHCHVTGIQYLELARILLVVYDPKIPPMGLGHRATMRDVDEAVIAIVLRICGIALSNQYSPPSLVVASVATRMCGDRFTDRRQQEALLELLVKLEDEHAWPTHDTQQLLQQGWGWT